MILPRYRIAPSTIPGAGQGLFLDEPVARGRIVVAPDAIPSTFGWHEILARPDRDTLLPSTVRWFEDRFTITPEWPDECYVNHAFEPNGVWHLGFIFAARDLAPGDELTVDYRHLLGEGQEEAFRDSVSGERIVGLSWAESLRITTAQLAGALA
jgi:hypothetical protein